MHMFFFVLTSISLSFSASSHSTGYSDYSIATPVASAPFFATNSPAQNFLLEGDKLVLQKRYNDALIYFGRAAFEFSNAKMTGKHAESLLKMSDVHRMLKNYKVAEDIVLGIALKSYTKLGSKSGEMNSYQQLGKIYLDEGRYTESLWFFTQQGIIAQQTANRLAYIESVLDIARLKIKKKEYTMATADVNRAEILAKSANTSQFETLISEARKSLKERI